MATASRQLLTTGSVYTLATAAPMLSGIVITPILTRSLESAEYGLLQNAIIVMNIGISVLMMGLQHIIPRSAFLDDTKEAGARGLAVRGALVVLPLSLIVTGLAILLSRSLHLDVPEVFLLAIPAAGGAAAIGMCQALAVARRASWVYVGLAFGMSVLGPLAGLVAIWGLDGGVTSYFLAVVCANLVTFTIAINNALRSGEAVYSWAGFRAALKISIPLVPHQLAVTMAVGLNVLVATSRFGNDGTARAQLGLLLASIPIVIVSAISAAWTPITLSAPPEERGPRLTATATDVAWIAALGGSALALLSPMFLAFLAPKTYDPHLVVPLVGVASLAAVIQAVYQAHSQVVFASGKTAWLAVFSPLAIVSGAGIGWLLVPVFGLAAIGGGYVMTYFLLWLTMRTIAVRSKAIQWSARGLWFPVAIAVVGSALGVFLPSETLMENLIRVTIAAILCLLALRQVRKALRRPKGADEIPSGGQPDHK